jgi:ferrochelatase
MSSYETVTVKAEQIVAEQYPNVTMDILPTFYDKPEYIRAMSDNIKNNINGFYYDHV